MTAGKTDRAIVRSGRQPDDAYNYLIDQFTVPLLTIVTGTLFIFYAHN